MRNLIIVFNLVLCYLISFSQTSYEEFMEAASTNERYQPKYGDLEKTRAHKKVDKKFIKSMMEEYDNEREASHHLVRLGFTYMYKGDYLTAMSRFNQAWLLDPANPDIFWGFGCVYGDLGAYSEAIDQFEEGLQLDPDYTYLLSDLGSTCLLVYLQSDSKDTLMLGYKYLQHAINQNDSSSQIKLRYAYCHYFLNNCDSSWYYFNKSVEIDEQNKFEDLYVYLMENCPLTDSVNTKTMDCSKLRTGTFEEYNDIAGLTIIIRTEDYQIEKNIKFNYKLKLKIEWLDDCTYQLTLLEDLSDEKIEDLKDMTVVCQIIEFDGQNYTIISKNDIYPDKSISTGKIILE